MLELDSLVLKPGAAPISHRFPEGRISVVLGRNRSGKTRLCRLLAGLEPTGEGLILLDGVDVLGFGAAEVLGRNPHPAAAHGCPDGCHRRGDLQEVPPRSREGKEDPNGATGWIRVRRGRSLRILLAARHPASSPKSAASI